MVRRHLTDTPPRSRPSFRLFDSGSLFFFGGNLRLDVHVAEFTRFKDLAALKALDKFRVFVTRDDLDTRMKTLLLHGLALGVDVGCVRRLDIIHVCRPKPSGICELSGILDRLPALSSD